MPAGLLSTSSDASSKRISSGTSSGAAVAQGTVSGSRQVTTSPARTISDALAAAPLRETPPARTTA